MKTDFVFRDSVKFPKTEMNTIARFFVMWIDRDTGKRKGSRMHIAKLEAQAFARRKEAEGFRVEGETQYFGDFA